MSVSATSGRRFARRVWARRWSRLRTLAVLGLALALLGAAGWIVLESSLLSVRSVQVTGASRLTPAEVLAVADVAPTTPLARVDTDAVARRVAALDAVRSVSVSRQWPRSVRIVVHERVPAAVQRQGTSYLLVDGTGVAFDTVRKRPKGLPLVTAPAAEGEPAFRAALAVLTSVPASVRSQLVEVRAASPDQVTLRLTRGRTVVWGSTERGDRKAAVLTALMSRRAAVYDVSAPDSPTTRQR
jgi:cell division septal protein FtsQ